MGVQPTIAVVLGSLLAAITIDITESIPIRAVHTSHFAPKGELVSHDDDSTLIPNAAPLLEESDYNVIDPVAILQSIEASKVIGVHLSGWVWGATCEDLETEERLAQISTQLMVGLIDFGGVDAESILWTDVFPCPEFTAKANETFHVPAGATSVTIEVVMTEPLPRLFDALKTESTRPALIRRLFAPELPGDISVADVEALEHDTKELLEVYESESAHAKHVTILAWCIGLAPWFLVMKLTRDWFAEVYYGGAEGVYCPSPEPNNDFCLKVNVGGAPLGGVAKSC